MIGQNRILSSGNKLAARSVTGSLLIWTLALAAPAIAPASVIFTNFGPSHAYDITEGDPVGNIGDGSLYAEGDTFTPAATTKFGSVVLALSCFIGCPALTNFTVDLDSDSGGMPGSVLESINVTGASLGSLGLNNTPITVNSVLQSTLFAGTAYWITVSSTSSFSLAWNFNSTSDPSSQAISTDGGMTWFAPSGLTPGAMEVDSAAATGVPEPGAGLLLISGGLLIGLLRKRFRNS